MNRWFERLRTALYGDQTCEPIIELLRYLYEVAADDEIQVAQINTDIIAKIRSLTTNTEVIDARGSFDLLEYRLDAIERQLEHARKALGMDQIVVPTPPRKEYDVTFIIEGR